MGSYFGELIEEFDLKKDAWSSSISIKTLFELVEAGQRLAILPPDFSVDDARRKVDVYRNCFRVMRNWVPKPYEFDLLHFRATQRLLSSVLPYNWERFVQGRVEIAEIACSHLKMGFEPHVAIVADRLKTLIANCASGAVGKLAHSPSQSSSLTA